jgi:hypothetical protein
MQLSRAAQWALSTPAKARAALSLALAAGGIAVLLRADPPTHYRATNWLFNYEEGLIARGLIGELAATLRRPAGYHMRRCLRPLS